MTCWKYRILKGEKVVSHRSGLSFRELILLLDLADDLFKANNPNSVFTEIQAEAK